MEDFGLYFQLGWQHIADWKAYDHILFVTALCATYLVQDWKKLLVLVTAFTIGHSVTLALSVFNVIHFSTHLIEFLIPCTILATALLNILKKNLSFRTVQLNYFFALFFGLIHGMGFSNYLKSLLGRATNIVGQLFAFNTGLEFGQLLIVTSVLVVSFVAINLAKVKQREWNLFVSAAIFGIALTMAIERAQLLLNHS